MPSLFSPDRFALGSRRSPRRPPAKGRRRVHFCPIVATLEERQLLTTPTLISVSASASNAIFGQTETLTATVQSNPPSPGNIPTGGTVRFESGTTVLGTATLSNGTASLSTVLPAGTYSVTAVYSGAGNFAASSSPTTAGYIFNVAGNGTFGNTVTSTGVTASSAELANPFGVAVGPDGTIFVADTFNNEIDAVNPNTGIIRVLAGNGTAGNVDGPALSAEFQSPRGLAFDTQLNALFIADRDNSTIRELNLGNGQVTTVAGVAGTFGFTGDGGPATSAELFQPSAVAVGPTGSTLWIADTFNNVIREVNLTNGIITTVAGTPPPEGTATGAQPNAGYTGDGGPATSAKLFDPSGVVLDSAGNLYIADSDNNVVRKVTASTQVITTIAGTGTAGYSGDNGPATSATLANPWGLALNSAGTALYIADRDNNAIRRIDLTTGIITTFAGNGTAASTGDNGPATSASMISPRSVAVDASGNVFIADTLGGPNPQGATGGSIRFVGSGSSAASVTVESFASIAPGNNRVFMAGVPTGVGRRKAQGIVLALAPITNANTARLRSSYLLSTPPNRAGKVKRIGIHRVTFDAANNIVRIFPRTTLNAHKTYRLIILGQPVGPVVLLFNRASILSETV